MYLLMKGYFILEVEEVAKSVVIFKNYEVFDLNDTLALRIRGQKENRITGLLRKMQFDLEKGDFVAAVLNWENHYKSGKAELRIMGEDHVFALRDPWKFVVHQDTMMPEKIPDVAPTQAGSELAKFDEKSLFAKVQGMIEDNNRILRGEFEEGNKENMKKMESMLTESINPLQEKMTTVIQNNEDTKAELQGIQKQMLKADKETKKTIKKGQKRNDKMLAALLAAQKIVVSEDDESEDSAEPEPLASPDEKPNAKACGEETVATKGKEQAAAGAEARPTGLKRPSSLATTFDADAGRVDKSNEQTTRIGSGGGSDSPKGVGLGGSMLEAGLELKKKIIESSVGNTGSEVDGKVKVEVARIEGQQASVLQGLGGTEVGKAGGAASAAGEKPDDGAADGDAQVPAAGANFASTTGYDGVQKPATVPAPSTKPPPTPVATGGAVPKANPPLARGEQNFDQANVNGNLLATSKPSGPKPGNGKGKVGKGQSYGQHGAGRGAGGGGHQHVDYRPLNSYQAGGGYNQHQAAALPYVQYNQQHHEVPKNSSASTIYEDFVSLLSVDEEADVRTSELVLSHFADEMRRNEEEASVAASRAIESHLFHRHRTNDEVVAWTDANIYRFCDGTNLAKIDEHDRSTGTEETGDTTEAGTEDEFVEEFGEHEDDVFDDGNEAVLGGRMRRVTIVTQFARCRRNRGRNGRRKRKELESRFRRLYEELRVVEKRDDEHVVSKLFGNEKEEKIFTNCDDTVLVSGTSFEENKENISTSFEESREVDNKTKLFAAAAVFGGRWRRTYLGCCFAKFVPSSDHKSINSGGGGCAYVERAAAAGDGTKPNKIGRIGFEGGVRYSIPTPKTILHFDVEEYLGGDEELSAPDVLTPTITSFTSCEADADGGAGDGLEAVAAVADGPEAEAVVGDGLEVDAVVLEPSIGEGSCGTESDEDSKSTVAPEGESGWGSGDEGELEGVEADATTEGGLRGVITCGAVPSKAQEAEVAPERNEKQNKKKKKIVEEGDEDDDEEELAKPSKKRKRNENPFTAVPMDCVEPLPGHRQLRVTNVNMMGTEVHNERLSWIADVAGWRGNDVALLSEFAYLKRRCKAAAKRKFARRLRRSERDEESSDDEANDEGGAAEYDDPIASKGEPAWVLRTRFDLLYINGCGIMLFNKKLRAQAKRIREQQQRHAIRSQTRFLVLYLSEVVLAATYAPTANASEVELETYDSTVVSMLQEMRKRRRDKWKLRVVGGDVNAHVGRDEFGDSVVHLGIGGARETNPRGRTFAKTLMATNTVLASSKFAADGDPESDDAYYTFKGRAGGIGRSEVDHFLVYGPHLSKFRAYRRVDYGAPDADGVDRARVGRFDHKSVEVLVDVRTRRRLEEEGEERAIAAREILEEVAPEVQVKFNEDLRRRVQVAGGDFHLEDFQDFLVDWLDEMSGKRSKQPPPDEADPEELEDNGRARAQMWKLFRDQKLNERPSSGGKGGITPQQAKQKYDEVGNSPLFPGEDKLPVDAEIRDLVEGFSAEMVEKLERPVSAKELKRAAQHLKNGGKAKDINGLGAAILLKLDDQSLGVMTDVVQKELRERDFHLLGGGLHTCRDVSLFKGKGCRSNPDGYRFLVISPLITKLLVRVMSERLYDALEATDFFQDSQFGFRRKRGTNDSMLVMNRLREDMRHYRFGSALRMMVCLIDLRKAFPSLDWRLVVSIVEALGIKNTKLWEVLNATHRSATHSFGDGSFVLQHGCKEGDPSSPLLFITAFTVVMKRFKQRLEARREAEGENEPDGVPLYVREEVWHLAREDKLCQLLITEKPGRTVQHVLDFLFADDTTLVQRATAEQLKQVREHDELARKEERRLLDLPIMEEFGATLTECGLRENESKRVQEDVVEITTRNLGMNVNPQADCDEKIRKAWKAYWTLRSRLSGIGGIGNTRRGELMQVMIRSILLYGLQTRHVSEFEANRLQREENKILAQILDCRWWEREMRGWTMADLRRRSKVPAFKIHLKFLQARFFAHVMRMPRDRVTWRAMVGKFVPPGIGDVGWLRSEANVSELAPADREMPDMMGDRIAHLTNECGLPVEMLRLLFETVEQANARRPDLNPGELYATNKNVFYAATRKWFVREVARDWARGDALAEERAADALIEKYFGDRRNPRETREQMRKMAVAMGAEITPDEVVRRHYRPSQTGLEGVFYSGRCKWCGVVYGSAEQEEIWCEPTEIATVPQLLKQHLHDCHKAFEPDEAEVHCRKEFVKLAKERDAQRSKWIRGQIIGRYSCLSEVRKTGPRRAGRTTHVSKIACRFCKGRNGKSIHFTSSAGAMGLHAEAHLRDDYIKNSQMYRRVRADDGTWRKEMINEFRPEYHQLHTNGHHFAGSDATLCTIQVPKFFEPRFVTGEGKPAIRCRFCKKFHVEYDEKEHDLSRRGKAVSWMRKHEAICSSRPKVVKVPWKVCKKATAKSMKKVQKKEK